MSISERQKNKVYRFRCTFKGVKYELTYYGTKKAAEKDHERWIQDVKNGFFDQMSSGRNLKDVYEIYKTSRNLEAATVLNYDVIIKKLDYSFWNADIASIDKFKANKTILDLKSQYSDTSAYTTYRFLKSLYNYCIDIDLIDKNPFSFKFSKPKEKIDRKEEVIALESIKFFFEVLDKMKSVKFRVLFLTAIGCGPRISEIIGFKKEDVDTTNHILDISKQYKHVYKSNGDIGLGLGILKTKSSRRRVHIPIFVREELYPYLETIPNGGWIFPGVHNQTPINRTTVAYHLNKICNEIGVKKLTVHDMRRMHATISLYSGNNVMTISNNLGHTTIDMTQKYLRKLTAVDNEATQKIDNFVSHGIKNDESEEILSCICPEVNFKFK